MGQLGEGVQALLLLAMVLGSLLVVAAVAWIAGRAPPNKETTRKDPGE
jgi:hypothetical protein